MTSLLRALPLLLVLACRSAPLPAPVHPAGPSAQVGGYVDPYDVPAPRSPGEWREGTALRQGYVGVTTLQELRRSGGSLPPVDGEGGTIDQYPVIGGGAQFKFGGDRVSWGLEALLGLGGRANGGAFVIGGGGAAVAVSLDLFVVDVYGGPFVSLPLGEKMRAYASAGPLVQFAQYHQSATEISPAESSGGFGIGGYARTGLEFQMSPGSLIGFGVRWSDSEVNLDSGLGDLDLENLEVAVTYSLIN